MKIGRTLTDLAVELNAQLKTKKDIIADTRQLTLVNFENTQWLEKDSVLKFLIQGGDLTMYGIMNAVTRASQDVEDYDRATELERMGGEILLTV